MLGCFVAAVVFDIVGIVKYGKSFVEVFQTIGYEIVVALVIYFCLAIIRAVVFLGFRLFGKRPDSGIGGQNRPIQD